MAGRRRPRAKGGVRIVRKTVEKIIEKIVNKPIKDFPHDEGELVVGSGIHEINIKTKNKIVKAQAKPEKAEKPEKPEDQPARVWVSLEEGGELPVCGGSLDLASSEITPDGFVLHLDIKSTERLVKWYVEL